jgi:HAMP domain-containing protein
MTRMRKTLTALWLASLAAIVVVAVVEAVLRSFDLRFAPLGIVSSLGWIVFVATSIYWIGVAVRFLLRRLFWRVGRRLALSYLLIGGLPFLFFAILFVVITYTVAAVLSQAQFRTERAWFVSKMDQWNLEYAVGGERPAAALGSMEVYDSAKGSAKDLPEWLAGRSFNGLVRRDKGFAIVSSRVYGARNGSRVVALVQPLDQEWRDYIFETNGMRISYALASESGHGGKGNARLQIDNEDVDLEIAPEQDMEAFFNEAVRGLLRGESVPWGDFSQPLTEWESGEPEGNNRLFTFILNPWRNLLDYYFNSPRYVQAVGGVILGFATALGLVYLLALILASGLIFSITRAVNRIEKGTKAVERGDFSYRINLRARNQLGEVAQSFDRMTGSISSLLGKVAEKERLQSEIDIAATIQRNLLPKEGPSFRGVSFAAHFEPSAAIGGDYYDVFNLDRTRLAVAIGDVSGHGLSTGLVMAMVKAAITTLVEENADEAAIFRRLNELVHRSTEKRAFMSLAFTIFDLAKGTIRHTNAGHLYPYILRYGEDPIPIEVPSLPLGLKGEIHPVTVELPLLERDTLVYLSDGIVEAQDPRGEPFGFDQVEAILARVIGHRPATIQGEILGAIARHSGNRPADDDRTVMVIRFDQMSLERESPPREGSGAEAGEMSPGVDSGADVPEGGVAPMAAPFSPR